MGIDRLLIEGGRPLYGEIKIQGSKNAALPLISAAVGCYGKYVLTNVPMIEDVYTLLGIYEGYGLKYTFKNNVLNLDSSDLFNSSKADVRGERLRASSYLLGALLPKFGELITAIPGGCKLGARPLDIHFDILRALGGEVYESEVYAYVWKNKKSATVELRFPSVGATINGIMLASSIIGKTVFTNVAIEPEVDAVIDFYKKAGVNVIRKGKRIEVFGKETRRQISYKVPFDRIVCGDYMLLAAATKGEVALKNVDERQERALITKLSETSCQITLKRDIIYITNRLSIIGNVVTAPYPYFPTDLQAQFAAACLGSGGRCKITEHIFGSRFAYADEFKALGGNVVVNGNSLHIERSRLVGNEVVAKDLRSGMALVIVGLCAKGRTTIGNTYFIERGYQCLVENVRSLGGNIKKIE